MCLCVCACLSTSVYLCVCVCVWSCIYATQWLHNNIFMHALWNLPICLSLSLLLFTFLSSSLNLLLPVTLLLTREAYPEHRSVCVRCPRVHVCEK